MPTHEPDDLLTERQLAEELHKSRSTLARWRRAGTGPPWRRVGKSPTYRWGDVRAWRDQQEGSSPGDK
jgi:predicted DNA-binding transcriptional regulator AlpA